MTRSGSGDPDSFLLLQGSLGSEFQVLGEEQVTPEVLICFGPSRGRGQLTSLSRKCVGSRKDGMPTDDQSDMRG
jgi:hypothetical protein